MIKLIPSANNVYKIDSDVDLKSLIETTETLMDEGEISSACQIRYDFVTDLMESLDEVEDDIELDMNHEESAMAVDLIVKSGIDHYFIGDYEVGAALFEVALSLDQEDHFGASGVVGFCYAGLQEWDSVDAVIESGIGKNEEVEFLQVLSNAAQGKQFKLSEKLQNALEDENSEIAHIVEPLKENFKTIVLSKK